MGALFAHWTRRVNLSIIALTMFRCVHLYESGTRCSGEVLEGTDFCPDHYPSPPNHDAFDDHPFQKLVARLVALILLLIFLIPFYYTLRTLYLELPPAAEEGR